MAQFQQYSRRPGSHTEKQPSVVTTRAYASLRLVSQVLEKGEYVTDPKNPTKDYADVEEGYVAFATLWAERCRDGKTTVVIGDRETPMFRRRVYLQLDNPSTLDPAQRALHVEIAKGLVLEDAPNGFEWAESTLENRNGDFNDSVYLRPARLPVGAIGKDDVASILKSLRALKPA